MDMIEILKMVKNGQRHFACIGRDISDLFAFQSLVAQIDKAVELGLVQGVGHHQETQSGQRMIDSVSIRSLTDEGEAFLAEH